MKGVGDYAVVYDISSHKERCQVERVLKGFGFRVQKSVFECRLDQRGKIELIRQLEALQVRTGFIKIYQLEYQWKPLVIGREQKPGPDEGPAFVV
jgi:CRISPR-associated protein Cas2